MYFEFTRARKTIKQKLHHQPSIAENSGNEPVGFGNISGGGGAASLSTITSGGGATNFENEFLGAGGGGGGPATSHSHHSNHPHHPHHSIHHSSPTTAGRAPVARSRHAMRAKLVKSMSEHVDDRPHEIAFVRENINTGSGLLKEVLMKRSESTSSTQPFEPCRKTDSVVINAGTATDTVGVRQSSRDTIEMTKEPGTSESPSIKYVFERKSTIEQEVSVKTILN